MSPSPSRWSSGLKNSPRALPNGLPGSKVPFLSPINPSEPHSEGFSGSNLGFLSPWPFPTSLSGSESAFSIPFTPLNPSQTAVAGSKRAFSIPFALPDGLAGSKRAFSSPSTLPRFAATARLRRREALLRRRLAGGPGSRLRSGP